MASSDGVFKVDSHSLLKLLAQPNMNLKIPEYQRPYRWLSDNVEELWEDIYQAYLNNKYENTEDKNYFLGSLITVQDKDTNYLNIIDGQQRITTLTILFSVIHRFMQDDVEIDEDDEEQLPQRISKNSVANCIWNEAKTRLRFKPKSDIGATYRDIVKNSTIEDIKERTITKKELKNAEPTILYYNTAKIFINKIEELTKNGQDLQELDNFNSYLFNNVKMIHIECSDESFAIKMFQIINNRGLALYSSDLIKSYLYSKFDEKTADSQEFNDYWASIEKNINDLDMSADSLFTIYQYYCLGENPKKSLDKEIINYFEKNNISPTDAVIDIKDFLENFKNVIERENKNIYALKYIPWEMYMKAIIVTAEKVKYAQKDELYHELARFYYLNYIAGQTLTKIKQTSFNLIKLVKSKADITSIQKEINNQLENNNILKLVKDNLSFENVYNTDWLKPLLLWIEYNELDECPFMPITRSIQIEHILPEEWKKNWSWFGEEKAKKYLNSIGNLTLLSGPKNIKASNEAYLDKVDVYSGAGRYKNKKDKCTSYRITQYIFDTYPTEWTETQIKEHANYYYEKIEDLLNIDLSELYDTKEEGKELNAAH